MYGPKYVWFFIGWYEDNWFKGHSVKAENINCTIDQMKEAAEGHFTTEALQWNQDKSPTISGKVTAVDIKKCDFVLKIEMDRTLLTLQIRNFENKNGPIVLDLFLVQVVIQNKEDDTAVCCKMSTKDILFFSQHNKQRFNPM